MMKQLNLNKPVTDLDGNPIKQQDKEVILGHVLAQALISTASGPAIKYYDWAISLKKEGTISVDQADLNALKEFVEQDKNLSILVKGPLLKALNE